MDKSIIREFAKLRVLTPCDFQRMDELVQDLSRALEESAAAKQHHAATSAGGATHPTNHHHHHHHHHVGHHHQQQRKRRGRNGRAPKLSLLLAQCSLTPPDPLLLPPSEESASSTENNNETPQIRAAGGTSHAPATGAIYRQPGVVGVVGGGAACKQSDSDEISSSGRRVLAGGQRLVPGHHLPVATFAESDSVNENFSPVRPHRRKRKFKRMAVDPMIAEVCGGPSSQPPSWPPHQPPPPHRRKDRGCAETTFADLAVSPVFPGKRKHSMRERSVEGDVGGVAVPGATLNHHHKDPLGAGGTSGALRYGLPRGGQGRTAAELSVVEHGMELGEEALYLASIESSSSLSSSESDAGIYTNDEGREGDDEHSDFYHEGAEHGPPGIGLNIPGAAPPWWHAVDENENDSRGSIADDASSFQSILAGSFQHMSYEAQQAFCARVYRLTNVPGREIRAGRRRLRDRRPGFSIVSSMNEKISKFLQDPEQNELRLHHMRKTEMDQLSHLASLYSLSMSDEGPKHNKCPVLTKTRNTTQAISVDKVGVANIWNLTAVSDIKRRRRTPPTSPEVQGYVGDLTEPIADGNVVHQQMMHGVDWESSLTLDSTGIRPPITTFVRPKPKFGFGFGDSGTTKPS